MVLVVMFRCISWRLVLVVLVWVRVVLESWLR